MPYIKAISGHTRLGAAQRYLEKEGRALARDFLNLDAPMEGIDEGGLPEYGDYDWSSVMDSTREKLGNDRPFKGRKARTYKHYVISPDPRDAVSLSRLRSVTMSWVEENFGDYEVAIVYHDDNEHHVPHAHVVVNNTNLDTGRRLQDPDPGALNGSLQRIARDAGLTHFVGRLDGAARDDTHYRRRAVDRTEASLARRGEYSWVADIRARVDVARGIAKGPEDFQQALREMGVNVREVAAGAIEVKDLRELVALSEAVSVVSRGGFRSLSAMDSAASRMRGMPNREATVARLERARQYCAEHGILPEKSTPQPSRRPAGSPSTRSNHRAGQEHHGGNRPVRQQTRRDERSER